MDGFYAADLDTLSKMNGDLLQQIHTDEVTLTSIDNPALVFDRFDGSDLNATTPISDMPAAKSNTDSTTKQNMSNLVNMVKVTYHLANCVVYAVPDARRWLRDQDEPSNCPHYEYHVLNPNDAVHIQNTLSALDSVIAEEQFVSPATKGKALLGKEQADYLRGRMAKIDVSAYVPGELEI